MSKPLTDDAIAEARRRLVRIAADLYVRDGLKGISMRSLARAAGMSRSTPYSYFRDKDDIVDCIRTLGFQRLAEVCTHAIASQSDVRDSLTAFGLAYVLFAARQPNLYRLMYDGTIPQDDGPNTLGASIAAFRQVAEAPLREGVLEGALVGEIDTLSASIRAIVHGLASLYLAGHFSDETELVARFRAIDSLLDDGCAPPTKKLYS
jgi:AcrR family transcriptional regulator